MQFDHTDIHVSFSIVYLNISFKKSSHKLKEKSVAVYCYILKLIHRLYVRICKLTAEILVK